MIQGSGEKTDWTPLFYVQDTRQYVGNCCLWWCPAGKGYTTQINEAGLFTEEECKRMRPTDKPWPRHVVEAAVCHHVRIEHLNKEAARLAAKE